MLSNRYNKYKDSGIEWIGEIPDSWNINKIGQIYQERNEKVSDKEFMPLSVTKNGIVPQLENAAKTDNGDNRKLVRQNDFVINSRSDRRGSCGISDYTGSVSLINTVLTPRKNMINQYYNFTFKSECFADEFYRWGTGIVDDLWSTKWSSMKNIYIPYPNIKEQEAIAGYLERKCGAIDETIEKQKSVIEKLKEYKQSIITQAVTKGLDKSAPMKDSGIEWIGQISQYWDSIKLKFCSYIRARLGWKGLKAEEYVEEGYPLLSAFNIVNSKLIFENLNFINQFRYDESPEIKLQTNDILLVKDGAGIGKCAIVENMPIPSTANGSLAVISTNYRLVAKFLYYYFISTIFQAYIDRLKDGMGVPHLFQADLKEIQIVIPKEQEQKNIVEFLDKKCSEIDKTIEDKEKLIEKLVEYKKSLIYECVTGKRKVVA